MKTYLPDFVENAGAMERFETLGVSAMLQLESAPDRECAPGQVLPEAAPRPPDR